MHSIVISTMLQLRLIKKKVRNFSIQRPLIAIIDLKKAERCTESILDHKHTKKVYYNKGYLNRKR